MNICLFSIQLPILVEICPTIIEILAINKWSLNFTGSRSMLSCLQSMELTDVSIDAIVALEKQKQRKWCLVPKILFYLKFFVKKKVMTIDEQSHCERS